MAKLSHKRERGKPRRHSHQQNRKREVSQTADIGLVYFPHEYNGGKLDNRGLNAVLTGQAYQFNPAPFAGVWEHLDAWGALDAGSYQLEPVQAGRNDRRRKKIAVYQRSDRLGTITFTGSWATFQTSPGCNPCRAGLIVAQLDELVNEYFLPANPLPERLIPDDQKVSIGVEGEPALINLDKLNLKLSEGDLPNLQWIDGKAVFGAYSLELQTGGGIGYRRKAAIHLRGRTIGTILWDAAFHSLNGTARYEIENGELYDTWNAGTFRGEIVDGLTKELGADVIGVFRVDIAIDGPGVITFLEAVHHREIMPVRKSAYHSAKKIVGLATNEIEGFSFGSRQSGRYIRVYNKSKEIRDGTKNKGDKYKSYITEFHKANGLTTSKDIGRLEVELLGKFLRTVEGFTWTDLFEREQVTALMKTALDKFFDFVETDHPDSKINRRPRVNYIDFSRVKADAYERVAPEVVESTRTPEILAKRLFIEAALTQTSLAFNELFGAAQHLVNKYALRPWLQRKRFDIIDQIETTAAEVGEPIYPNWRSLFDQLSSKEFQPISSSGFTLPDY